MKRTLLANLGDASADSGNLDYGAYYIYSDGTADYVEAPTDDEWSGSSRTGWKPSARFLVYRVCLDRCTYIDGILSDNQYHPELPAWFAPSAAEIAARPQDSKLADVAIATDCPEDNLIADLCSENVLERARAYEAIYGYYGWDNGDSYPLSLTAGEVRRRYRNVRRTLARAVQA